VVSYHQGLKTSQSTIQPRPGLGDKETNWNQITSPTPIEIGEEEDKEKMSSRKTIEKKNIYGPRHRKQSSGSFSIANASSCNVACGSDHLMPLSIFSLY
jgi:hypothetical protein